jgi:hypothetical protein
VQKLTEAFPGSADARNNAAGKQHPGSWGVYAAAAGAALAMSTNASAEIVYSGAVDVTASVPVGSGLQSGPLHKTALFTVAGLNEMLQVSNQNWVTGHSHRVQLGGAAGVSGSTGVKFFVHKSNGISVIANFYHRGSPINGGVGGLSIAGILRQHTVASKTVGNQVGPHTFHNTDGAFGSGNVTGFVGFKTPSGDLGWLQVQVNDAGSPGYPNEAEVIDWAYDNSGAPIAAGDTGVPEPGTAALSLLALGAVGILALRKRRNELAAK